MGTLEFGILIFFVGSLYLLFSISLSLDTIKRELESKKNIDLYSIESKLDSICNEIEEMNFYRNFPEGNFYEHKRKFNESLRNPDSFHKLTKIEEELKK